MDLLIVYPRGYTTGSSHASQRMASSGDIVIGNLYDHLTYSKGAGRRWSLHAQVLQAALTLFGDFHAWLDTQLSNPLLSSTKKDYLLDMLAFIDGRNRMMSHASWMFVLEEVRVDLDQFKIQRLNQSSELLDKSLTTIQVLQRWCQQPEGVLDLLTTLHVLFGPVGRTTA